MLNGNKKTNVLLFLVFLLAAAVITGCGSDEKFVYVQAAGTTANAVTQHSLVAVAGQNSILNTSSFKFELPADTYSAGTEIIVKEDTAFTSLGNSFSGRYTPQSAVLNLTTINKQSASILPSLMFSVAQTDGYILNGVATLTITLLNNNEYKPQNKYFVACKTTAGDWSYLGCKYIGAGKFVINFTTKYAAYVLVKRNDNSVPLLTEGLILHGPTSVVAPHSGIFENDAEFALSLSKSDDNAINFNVSELKISFISFDKQATLPFESYSNDVALYPIAMQQSGNYYVTLPHPLSVFSSYSSIGGNATYTFKMKLTDRDVASFPAKLLMRATYRDSELYAAEKIVAFSRVGTPDIYPTVMSVSPASGSVNLISDLTHFSVSFKEEMLSETLAGALVLQEKSPVSGVLGEEIVCGLTGYNSALFVASYSCPVLVADKDYVATVRNVKNKYNHILQTPFSWPFKVVSSSGVLSVTPANAAVGVATNSLVVINYQKEVADTSEVNFDLRYADSGNIIGFTPNWTSNSSVTLTPYVSFDYNKAINLNVSGGSDVDGYALVNFSSSFTTIDRTVIASVSPVESATNVPSNAPIIITFSKSMADSAQNAVTLERKLPLEGAYSPFANVVKTWLNNNKELRILPANGERWVYNADYRVNVTGAAMDSFNNSIAAKTWSFKVTLGAAPVISTPVVSNISRYAANVAFSMSVTDGRPLNTAYVGVQIAEFPNDFTAPATTITEVAGVLTGTSVAADVTAALSNLERNTQYWLRVYYKLENDNTVYYSATDPNDYVRFDTAIWEGKGTDIEPYLISSIDELKDVKFLLSGKFKQSVDLDLTGVAWIPLGETSQAPFTGVYDGNQKKIQNLSVVRTNSEIGLGMFGYAQSATLRGITLNTVRVTESTEGSKIGGLIGVDSASSITGCDIVHAVITGCGSVGGFIGEAAGSIIDNSRISGNVTITANNQTSSNVGGIVGLAAGVTVRNYSAVNGSLGTFGIIGYVNAGGVVGSAIGGLIENVNITEVNINNSKLDKNVGAVAGNISNGTVITGVAVANTNVNADNLVGGIVGECDTGSVNSSTIDTCTIVATDENPEVGILFGRKGAGTTANCSVIGLTIVNGTSYQNEPVQ